jgi:branched-chain amino acid transport system ATP-binding protein
MKALLKVNNLSKNFGAVIAAEDINVTIGEKEVVGIIGANGAGKTTFVNIITGYVKPTAGSIRFQGRDITGLPPRKIIRMGICRSFQITQLFPEMDVWENLMVSCTLLNNQRLRPRSGVDAAPGGAETARHRHGHDGAHQSAPFG